MDQRISVITLGVADLTRACAFYRKLGWRQAKGGNDDVAFFQANGLVLSLYAVNDLARDAGLKKSANGFGNVTIAQNVRKKSDVARLLQQAKKAGAKITCKADKVFWGGTIGYFSDPDGHVWEIAHNPFWKIDAKGNIRLPK